jgi:hypothetical protein
MHALQGEIGTVSGQPGRLRCAVVTVCNGCCGADCGCGCWQHVKHRGPPRVVMHHTAQVPFGRLCEAAVIALHCSTTQQQL